MARLYSDEDFPFSVVKELRRLSHDVITIQERGQAGLEVPDETVLAFAHGEGRALLTFNRWDFIRLHNQGEEHSGIIARTVDFDTAALAQRIHKVIETHASLSGQLIRIYRSSR
jgi:hypothetical protein